MKLKLLFRYLFLNTARTVVVCHVGKGNKKRNYLHVSKDTYYLLIYYNIYKKN